MTVAKTQVEQLERIARMLDTYSWAVYNDLGEGARLELSAAAQTLRDIAAT